MPTIEGLATLILDMWADPANRTANGALGRDIACILAPVAHSLALLSLGRGDEIDLVAGPTQDRPRP